MSQRSESKRPAMDDLSSLMDGELEASAVGRACAQWRDDDEARANWHAYHLIGDVLRSEDLASDGEHDAAFLAAFRSRKETTGSTSKNTQVKSTAFSW